MTGRYITQTKMGSLIIHIKKSNQDYNVAFELLAMPIPFGSGDVAEDGQSLIVTSTFFMRPGHESTLRMDFGSGKLMLSGEHIIFGALSGEAEPFTGKTAADIMDEELPKKRTGKRVKRNRKEIDGLVDELLSKMTLEEKIGQMAQSVGDFSAFIGGSVANKISEDERIRKGMVGAMNGMSPLPVMFAKQKLAVEESRLGIPLLFCQDVIHGKDTIFPIPLAWACSFNPELVREACCISAKEATAKGIMYTMGPMVDIARDARWGRISEGAGEDPYLGSLMSVAQVKGYQGESLYEEYTMMATLKHYIGYGAAEAGRDYNTVEISDTTLRNIYLPPFKAGLDAGAASVMNSFNVINGVPMAINKAILNNLLRGELGFEGIVISDYGSIEECIAHGAADDMADAAAKAVEASMDIEMATSAYQDNLPALVESGRLDITLINTAASRVLRYKFESGLFDDPYKYFRPEDAEKSYSEENLAVSKRLALESAVLLKNNGALPLDKSAKIALIGPKSDSTDLLGPWQFSSHSAQTVTLKQGLEAMGCNVISCVKGCDTLSAIDGGIAEAVKAAGDADVVILALGEDAAMSGEAASRQNITVPEPQMKLAAAVKECGKPVVLVLTNGRPLLLDWFDENADAILETWFLGSQAGAAIADILTGVYNPNGKLSVTFPRHAGQIPLYYNHLNTGRPYSEGDTNTFLSRYLDGPNTPLYPFGHGLSYASFEMSDLKLSADSLDKNGKIEASIKLTNTGKLSGTQIIQLYLRDIAASISRPVKELKGFERVTLASGESARVSFEITERTLRFVNACGKEVSEPGFFEVMIGTSSSDADLLKSKFALK